MGASEKILVVRVGHAGDLVMVTPALAALLEGFPAAEIHLLTSREGRRVLADYHPRLTRTWLYERRFPQRLWHAPKLMSDLRDQGYTRVYLLETKRSYRRRLGAVAPLFHAIEPHTAGAHYSERCLAVVTESLGAQPQKRWVELPVSAAGLTQARALLAEHGVEPGDRLVGLHPTFSGSSLPWLRGRQKSHRQWPAVFFAQLGRLLRSEANRRGLPLKIVIDALPEERALVEPIVRHSAGAITVIAAAPDFARYKAMLQIMDVLVTPNTGPMHIAAAVGTPVVALFSGWSAGDCGPYVPADRYVALAADDTPHAQRGLAAITPEQVVAPVFDLLAVD